MRYKPQSIKDKGLDEYLDETAGQHNGFGAWVFRKLLKAHVNETNLARAFNVTRTTMKKWLTIDKETKARHEAEIEELSNV
jgi:hypothetical protein